MGLPVGDVYLALASVAAQIGAAMITLTIILLLVFVPSLRRAVSRLLWSVLAAVGIVFLIAPKARPPRRGF